MSSLAHLQSKIESVQMIAKISTAMRFASQAALTRGLSGFQLSNQRMEMEEKILSSAWSSCGGEAVLPKWARVVSSAPKIYIVLGTEKGFCGAMTEFLLRAVESNVSKQDVIWASGVNFIRRLKGRGRHCDMRFKDLACLKGLADLIEGHCKKKPCGGISFIYPHYISMISWEIREKPLMPFFQEVQAEQGTFLEEDECSFWGASILRYITTSACWAWTHKEVSEHSSRMTAMDKAANNADEMQEKLKQIWQRKRQELVTSELLEVTAGAVAIEGG